MTTRRTNPTWIWYYGDFEIHQHMLMGLQREERGNIVPAFWKLFDCNRLIRFTKRGRLEQDETIYGWRRLCVHQRSSPAGAG